MGGQARRYLAQARDFQGHCYSYLFQQQGERSGPSMRGREILIFGVDVRSQDQAGIYEVFFASLPLTSQILTSSCIHSQLLNPPFLSLSMLVVDVGAKFASKTT